MRYFAYAIQFPTGTVRQRLSRTANMLSASSTDLGAVFGFRIDLDMQASQIGASAFGDLASAKIKAQIALTNDPP